MIFEPLPVAGAFLVRLERHPDERGFFARTWCEDEFRTAGIHAIFVQQSLAHSVRRGTLRGMHLQLAPNAEAKYVRCVAGAIFDALVDLRSDSPTYLRSASVEIDAADGGAVYVPAGCAHGYQTLIDNTEVLYAMSSRYAAPSARSIRWSDAALGVAWPLANPILSAQDANAPTLEFFLDELRASGSRVEGA
jgi:dTDP-4-dehydrorhamnose 3,5-epimerase